MRSIIQHYLQPRNWDIVNIKMFSLAELLIARDRSGWYEISIQVYYSNSKGFSLRSSQWRMKCPRRLQRRLGIWTGTQKIGRNELSRAAEDGPFNGASPKQRHGNKNGSVQVGLRKPTVQEARHAVLITALWFCLLHLLSIPPLSFEQ